jgi:hypothetical protein
MSKAESNGSCTERVRPVLLSRGDGPAASLSIAAGILSAEFDTFFGLALPGAAKLSMMSKVWAVEPL